MKKYQALTLGLVATASLATYLTYKKGYRIRALCQFSKEETRTASDTLKSIQKNIQIIKEQTALIKQLSQDSQKKWHLFQQETAPKKAEINKRLKHLKTITQH